MVLENNVKKLKCELAVLQRTVGVLRADKNSRTALKDGKRQRIDDILDALHEDILVFEKGIEIIDKLLADEEK